MKWKKIFQRSFRTAGALIVIPFALSLEAMAKEEGSAYLARIVAGFIEVNLDEME